MKNRFAPFKVLVVAGTGGVGKTTLSAALAIQAAQAGQRVLVLTIDPARRLAQALGLDSNVGETVAVPGVDRLFASMIDARKEFDEFVLGSIDSGVANALFKNRLYQQLASNLSGSQEFTSLVRLNKAVRSGDYDLVVLDTPPMQNAEDFFAAPDRLSALFSESVMSWFTKSDDQDGIIKKMIHRGTRLVTSALESVTGSVFLAELKDFFNHVSHLKNRIREVSDQTRALLKDAKTGFILVTGFDEPKLKEALEFQQELTQENFHLTAVVVNRWFPDWKLTDESQHVEWRLHPKYALLQEFYESFSSYFQKRREMFEYLVERMDHSVPVLRLPDYKRSVLGIDELRMIANKLEEKWELVESKPSSP